MNNPSFFCLLGFLAFKLSVGQQIPDSSQKSTLKAQLDTIYQDDQNYRRQTKALEEKYGRESAELLAHWALIQKKDSLNQIKIQNILDNWGWLGPDEIGDQGNATLFLVIQHAPLEIQEKYVPMMREAVIIGNATSGNLALLEDRVAIRKGEKQIYGSQIGRDQHTGEYYVLPLMDPDNVDLRRREAGLGELGEYIRNWGLTWDVEAYKKSLPELEGKLRN